MIRHCEHIKANGHFCGSPAMGERNYCFFHMNHIGRKLRAEKYAARCLEYIPELPLLEDAASIQLALMQVTDALLHGALDPRRAGLVLYALQTASINLRRLEQDAQQETNTAVCNRYDSFEEDYELDDSDGLRVDESAMEAAARDELAEHASPTMSDSVGGEATGPAGDAPKREISDVARLIEIGHVKGFMFAKESCVPRGGPDNEDGPILVSDREVENVRVRIPLVLTPVQYQQARMSIVEYEKDNGIDRNHPEGRMPVPQRAAKSQKIFMGLRKPPVAVQQAECPATPMTRSFPTLPAGLS